MSRKVLLILIVILLIASAVRLHDPTFRSLWGDEAHTVFNAYNLFRAGFISSVTGLLNDSHFPVYFLLLAFWMKLFGAGEYALRLLSVLIGITSVGMLFFLAREMFEEKTALLASFLLALSPLAVMYSQEIRMYGLVLLLAMVSVLYFWRLLRGKRDYSVRAGYVVATVLLALTHVYAILFLAAQFICLLVDWWRGREGLEFKLVFFSQFAVLLFILPFYVYMIVPKITAVLGGVPDMAFGVFPWYLKLPLFFLVLSLGQTVAPWNVKIIIPAGLIFGFLFVKSFKWQQDKRIVFLLVLVLFPLVFSSLFLPPTLPKHLILVLPFYLLLIAHSLLLLRPRFLRFFIVVCMVLIQASVMANYFGLREYHNANQLEPWREVSALIRDKYQKGDVIIATNNFVAYRLLEYYLNDLDQTNYPLYSLQKGIYAPSQYSDKYPFFERGKGAGGLAEIKAPRVWFVSQIADERAFPPGYVERARNAIAKRYRLAVDRKFIPYQETLVAKLPIRRHRPNSSRIRLSLYDRINSGCEYE